MRWARFSEGQIVAILRANDAGAKVGGLARKQVVSEGTICAWKAKFGQMSVSDVQRSEALGDENQGLRSSVTGASRRRRGAEVGGRERVADGLKIPYPEMVTPAFIVSAR